MTEYPVPIDLIWDNSVSIPDWFSIPKVIIFGFTTNMPYLQ